METPGTGKEDLKSIIGELSNEKKEQLLFMLREDREQREANMLENLKKSVKIDEDKEFMGLKGKIIHIDIPAKGKFKGFKLNLFVSNNRFEGEDIDGKIEDQMVSWDQLDNLAEAIKEYMEEYGISLSYVEKYQENHSQEFKKCIKSMFSSTYHKNIYHENNRTNAETLVDSHFFIKGEENGKSQRRPIIYRKSFSFEPFGTSLVSGGPMDKVMLNL